MKKKLYEFVEKRVNNDNIQTMILLSFAVVIFIKVKNTNDIKISDMIDYSVILSVTVLFLSKIISAIISKFIGRICEDAAKLSYNYGELAKKYQLSELITIFKESGNTRKTFRLPVELICVRKATEEAYEIKLNYSQKNYVLPKQIARISSHLIKAHKESVIYNSRCFRVDKITKINSEINMNISKTSYYDSLLTNRAMGFRWPDGRSIREVYEPGPYITSLEDSKMSNHIGINGIIETIDERFIFFRKSRNNSIGKNTIGTSIGTLLKAKYALKRDDSLIEDTIVKVIEKEIEYNLGIKDIEITNENIVAIYRDLVEGGKPQILFYKKLDIEKEIKAERAGGKPIFIKKNTVMNGEFKAGGIGTSSGFYSMMPSVVASIVLIKYHLDDSIPFPLQNTNQDKLTENRE